MYDLNKLIAPGSRVTLSMPLNINDGGEIATWGVVNRYFVHAVLLTPKTMRRAGVQR
jgi:hypothetical protein